MTAALAGRTLALAGDTTGLAKLRSLTGHADAKVRQEALLALGELRDRESRERLTRRLEDESLAVRACAVYALGMLRIPPSSRCSSGRCGSPSRTGTSCGGGTGARWSVAHSRRNMASACTTCARRSRKRSRWWRSDEIGGRTPWRCAGARRERRSSGGGHPPRGHARGTAVALSHASASPAVRKTRAETPIASLRTAPIWLRPKWTSDGVTTAQRPPMRSV